MSGTFRLLFTGSRDHQDKPYIWSVLDVYLAKHPDMVVVHGECYPPEEVDGTRLDLSADWLAHLWCLARGVPDEPHAANWATHGRSAGPIRNAGMVKLGADGCAAFPLGDSRGTLGCARLAKKAGIPTEIYERSSRG